MKKQIKKQDNLAGIGKFIKDLAKKAGEMALKSHNYTISFKKKHEIVTSIDKKIEKFLTSRIKRKFPDHCVMGEESGKDPTSVSSPDDKYIWIIDPIDGTINFARGYPHFCTCIALLKDSDPIFACVYDPTKDHLFFAAKGKGFFLNNKRHHVSSCKKLSEALVEISESDKSNSSIRLIDDIIKKDYRIRVGGSTALSLCYVAAGFIDCRIKTTIGKYDVAGGALMVKEAGGVVVDFDGKEWKLGKSMIATNKYLKNKFLHIV